jgi:hypothetical protein
MFKRLTAIFDIIVRWGESTKNNFAILKKVYYHRSLFNFNLISLIFVKKLPSELQGKNVSGKWGFLGPKRQFRHNRPFLKGHSLPSSRF